MMRGRFWGVFLALCMLLSMPAQAQDIPARSPLGIDYMELTQGNAQLAGILLAGEAEWMQNADERYKSLEIWKATCGQVTSEEISKRVLRKLMQFTPQMVLSFIELPKERYPLLQAIGGLAKAKERYAEAKERNAEAKERNAEAEEMLKRAQAIAGALGVRK